MGYLWEIEMNSDEQTSLNRRGFLKLAGIGLGGLLLHPGGHASASDLGSDDIAILYDASKCVGCRACEEACREYNELSSETTAPSDLSGFTGGVIQRRGGVDPADHPFLFYQCMHCTEAACVTVCPTGALHKDERGFVAFDAEQCNGCGYCTQFCPFGVPRLGATNTVTGEAQAAKCTFCQDKVRAGYGGPSCAEACPTGALTWGKRDMLLRNARDRVASLQDEGHGEATLYGAKEAGGLHRLSVLLDDPATYGLPDDPAAPIALSAVWQRMIQPLGGVALGATGLGLVITWLVARTKIKVEEA
jgi:formate dehydrogenase iron-sulfur subunit